MISIFDLSQGQRVMLEQREHVILARQSVNGVFRNEFVLADQVVKFLGGAVYQNSLFFLYQDEYNQIILRNVFDMVVYCRIDLGEYSGMQIKEVQGLLNVFAGKMVISLIIYDAEEQYFVRLIFPFERELDREMKVHDSSVENLQSENLRLQKQLKEIHSENEERQKQIMEIQSENDELQKQIKEQLSQFAESQEQMAIQKAEEYEASWKKRESEFQEEIVQKEKEFQKQFEEQEARYQAELQKEEKLKLMLESAKKQYSELMEVATKYRDEAIRWRSKFI